MTPFQKVKAILRPILHRPYERKQNDRVIREAIEASAPNFAEMCDHFLAQEAPLRGSSFERIPCESGTDARHALNAFVGFLTRRFKDYAPGDAHG